MATSEINKILATLIDSVRNQPLTFPSPGAPDIAQQILHNSRQNWQPKTVDVDEGGPSVISRIFDVLSRPNYAVAESYRRVLDPESESILKGVSDAVSGLGAGLRGDVDPNEPGAQKTTFSRVLEQEGVENKAVRGGVGFALDVLLDPTTYIGVGAVRAAGKGALKLFGKETVEQAIPKAAPTLSLAKATKPKQANILEPHVEVEPAESLLDQIVNNAVPVHPITPKPKVQLTDPTEISIAQKTAREYMRKLKIPTDRSFSPRQQILLYTNLLRKVGNDPVKAAGMYTESERWLTTQGINFKLWEGSRGSLSDVLSEIGSRKFTPDLMKQYSSGRVVDPNLMQAAEIIRARSAMADEPKIQGLLQDISKAMAIADSTMSPAAAKNVKKNIKLHQPELLLSPVGFNTVNKFIKELGDQSEGYVQVALNRKVRTLHAVVSGDTRKISDVTAAMNRAKEEALGIHYKSLGDRRAFDTLAMAFSTWYRNPQLRALGHTSTLLARSSAARRLHDLNRHLKGRSQAQINAAWRAAQGYVHADDDLAKYFRDNLESMFSSSGVVDEVESTALRSALTMKDMNRELARLSSKRPAFKTLRFTQKHVTDPITGKIRDYSGTNWLKSWETWQTAKPQEVFYGLQTALENVMKDYALKDDIAARFGSKIPHGEFTHKIEGIPRLSGYYFPKEIAEQIPVMFRNLEDMYQSKAPITRIFDHALSTWKRGVTIYVPSHHVRSLMGDVFFNWMAGVTNPRVYTQSAQILKAMRHRYEGAHIDELVGVGAPARAVGQGRVIYRKNGTDITDEMLYTNAFRNGLFLSARDIEDVLGDGLTMWQPFSGKVNQAVSKAAELREHYVILAHYIDAVRRSKETNLGKAFESAAAEVRKWHPNGTDLTATERNVFRRIIPFYSWNRKAIPLIIESIFFNPGKVAIIPKGIQGAQGSLGIEGTRDDPFPVDQAFPDWLREQGIGPMGRTGMGGLAGFIGSLGRTETQNVTGEPLDAYTVLGTRLNPVTDMFGQLTPNPLQGIMESTNPAIQMLFELGQGRTLSGREIETDPLRYTAESIPIVDPLYRIFNRPGSERGRDETPWRPFGAGPEINIEALLNTLFAAGIVGTGPYVPQQRR